MSTEDDAKRGRMQIVPLGELIGRLTPEQQARVRVFVLALLAQQPRTEPPAFSWAG